MINVNVNAKLDKIKSKSPKLKKNAVTYVANELLRKSEPYIPFDTGMLRDSGISHSVPEQGKLIWKTPYAKAQWLYGKSKGLRGKQWALRAWADHGKLIIKNTKRIAAGRG